MKLQLTTGVLLLAASGCAVPAGGVPIATAGDLGKSGFMTAVTAPAARPIQEEAAPAASEAPGITPLQHSIWNSVGFQKRFAQSYAAVSAVEPEVSAEEFELIQLAQTQMADDDLAGAIATLEAAAGPTATAAIDFQLGNMRYQGGDTEAAIADYQLAADKFPAFRRAWMNLGSLKKNLGDDAGARTALTQALRHGAVSPDVYGALGEATANLGHHAAAESALRFAMLLEPENLRWQQALALSLIEQERGNEAVAVIEGMLIQMPDNANLHEWHAKALYGSGRLMEAAASFEMSDRLGGGSVGGLLALGGIYANGALPELAVTAYDRALAKAPEESLKAALSVARVLAYNGELDAVEKLTASLEERAGFLMDDEQRSEMLKLESRIAVARGDDTGQAAVLQEIVALNPLDGEALILLAEMAERAGELDAAILQYERAGRLGQFEAEAKRKHAILLVRDQRYGEALPLLRRSVDLEPREWVEDYLEKVEGLAKTRP